jgi:hypothetical protein
MFDKRNAGTVLAQVHEATRRGTHFAAFAYNSLFERLDRSGRPIMDDQSASRAALRNQLIPRLRRLATGVNRRYNRAAFDGRSDDEVHAQATNGTSCISGGLPL